MQRLVLELEATVMGDDFRTAVLQDVALERGNGKPAVCRAPVGADAQQLLQFLHLLLVSGGLDLDELKEPSTARAH